MADIDITDLLPPADRVLFGSIGPLVRTIRAVAQDRIRVRLVPRGDRWALEFTSTVAPIRKDYVTGWYDSEGSGLRVIDPTDESSWFLDSEDAEAAAIAVMADLL